MKKLLSRGFKIPHAFIFLSGIILFCALLTYVVPSGVYQRTSVVRDKVEQNMIVPGSYSSLPKYFSLEGLILGKEKSGYANPTSLLGLFTSIPKGMNQAGSLIFFVFIIGAVFNVIQHTGTVSVVMFRLLERFRNSPRTLFFCIYLVIFMGASFLGMGAEFIPLIPIFLLIAKEMGYDRIFGIGLFLIPAYVGWTGALTNPFNVQIAQQVAELPIGSGMSLRLVIAIIFFILGFLFLMQYGKRVRGNLAKSIMPEDRFELEDLAPVENLAFKRKHLYIIFSSAALFGTILYGVQAMGWGLIEMSGGFFMVGVAAMLLGKMSGDEAMKAFIGGLEMMIVPALIIGFARGIQVVLTEGQIVDTLLHQTATLLEQFPHLAAVEGMFAFQSVLNFFIPSASGQALVSMPLMVPLSDLLNISRQTAVLTYVLGDGLSNLLVPTNGELMAIIGIAGVPFEKWFRFIWKLFLWLSLLAAIFLVGAVYLGY